MPLRFTPDDHARVAGAIRAAEAGTAGEIYAVFARRADDYRFVAAAVALAASMASGLAVSLAAAALSVPLPALWVEGAQVLGTLALFAGLTLAPGLLMLFVPAAVARGRAAALARAQFLAHNLHATAERTGILVFVSEAERHAEVIADAGIAGRVPQGEWDAIVAELTEAAKGDRLAEGFVRAVERSGALLAEAFPPRPGDRNEIPDRLVEI